jgi:hypothetical protein
MYWYRLQIKWDNKRIKKLYNLKCHGRVDRCFEKLRDRLSPVRFFMVPHSLWLRPVSSSSLKPLLLLHCWGTGPTRTSLLSYSTRSIEVNRIESLGSAFQMISDSEMAAVSCKQEMCCLAVTGSGSQKIKTAHKLKAQTSKIVSSFKGPTVSCCLVREYSGHKDGIWEVAVARLGQPIIGTAAAGRSATFKLLRDLRT